MMISLTQKQIKNAKAIGKLKATFVVLGAIDRRVVGSLPDMKTLYAFSSWWRALRFRMANRDLGGLTIKKEPVAKLLTTARRAGFTEILWDHPGGRSATLTHNVIQDI